MEIYKSLLEAGGYARLKTDNTQLFEYTLEQLQLRSDIYDLEFTADVYNSDLKKECFDIKTRYEQEFSQKGEKIKYLRFRFVS
jgi:tRNA (guanine-N7-)-methyltransferase